ncbi:MAG: glycerate dehydrogenase [Firmicutes bacterium HGW-Firmicutes-10]|nr:MAG: glycerate dehydrogenase [Firmicutes bacterium HGW-Firmicutes-10]
MKIVILDGYTCNPGDLLWDKFEKFGEVTVYDRTNKNEVLQRANEAEIVFTNKTVLDRETIHQLSNLKYIGVLATGYNVVDVEAAKEKGIVVTNVPGYSTASVAQHVFSLLLEIAARVGHHDQTVKNGQWSNSIDFCYWNYPLMEIANKTFGVLGYGRIGKQTAQIAKAFGMNVIAYDRGRTNHDETVTKVTLTELFKQSDIITLHVPLFEDTKEIINKQSIDTMKDGVILINTSRGPLIKEQDLADALKPGKVKAAGLDVLTQEPPAKDNPLIPLENCLITPHIAWAPIEARIRLLDIAADNLDKYLNGIHQNKVN